MRSQYHHRLGKQVNYKKRILWSLLLVILAAFVVWAVLPSATPPIRDSQGNLVPGSVARFQKVTLGGHEQWLLLRGHRADAPILLVLHGGPGSGIIASARHYQAELEEHFLVVNWDQRGAGKSWNSKLKPEDITPEALLGDTIELTQWLTREFNQDKVFVLGHSWGSYLALRAAQTRPDLYAGIITAGQMVDVQRSEEISWEYTHNKAVSLGNAKAVKELEDLGPPPYADLTKALPIQRKWLIKFGGADHSGKITSNVIRHIVLGREYNLVDGYRFLRGQVLSGPALMNPLGDLNMFTLVPKLQVPIWIANGRHDYLTPYTLTQEYFEALDAPHKEMIWFEHSAHSPLFEEHQAFNQMIITRVLPWAR